MQNSIYKIKYLLFLSWDWGVIPPLKETLLEMRGGSVFTA